MVSPNSTVHAAPITQVGGMLVGLTGAINLRGHRGPFYFPTHSTACDLNVQPRRPKNEGFMGIFVKFIVSFSTFIAEASKIDCCLHVSSKCKALKWLKLM